MSEVFLGLGSNIEPESNLATALTKLSGCYPDLRTSPIYRSTAQGFEGDDFLNCAVQFTCSDTLGQLLRRLRQIEEGQGRVASQRRFAPRSIDIDLLSFGSLVGKYEGKELPRPDILLYAFVLKPLSDLAPTKTLPGHEFCLSSLWEDRARLLTGPQGSRIEQVAWPP